MGKVLKRLQLQFFLILWIVYSVKAAPYSKYGRTCRDIGCLPREVCQMSYDTCSFNQQEGTNCGRYPTCVKADKAQQQPPAQNTGPSDPSPSNTNIWNLPTTTQRTTTTQRSTTTTTTTRRAWTTQSPFYNPSNPSYGGGGNYFGNRYGDGDSLYGGGSSHTIRSTTRRPSSPSSSSSGSFLSGLSNFLAGDGGKLISGFLSSRGGSGSNSGGFGSLFGGDTRPLIENKNYRGGLFSENTNSNNNAGAYPVTRYGEAANNNRNPTQQQQSSQSSGLSHGNVGWKLS